MRHSYFNLGRIALVLIIITVPTLWAQAASDATRFIDDRAHRVIEMFNNPELSQDQRENGLRALVVESFDVPTISRFVLGRHWARATPAERDQFTKAFEHYIVHIYASRFSQSQNARVKITGERQESSDRMLVRSEIDWRGSTRPAKVDWWIKKVGNSYKIIDVLVEGVSQLVTLRDEFSAVIQQHDGQVAGLIDHLKEKIAE